MKANRKIVIAFLAILILLWLGYFRFNRPFFFQHGKGGFGVAGNGVYVITVGEKNEICWGFPGARTWTGKTRGNQETVVFDGSRVIPFRWSLLKIRPIVFRFTPERIYIYDMKNFSGGYYLRRNQ